MTDQNSGLSAGAIFFVLFIFSGGIKSCQKQNIHHVTSEYIPSQSQQWSTPNTYSFPSSFQQPDRSEENESNSQYVPSPSQQWGTNTYPSTWRYQSQPDLQENNESNSYGLQDP